METIVVWPFRSYKTLSHTKFHLLSQKPREIGIVGIPTLQTRKVRSREVLHQALQGA